MAEEPDKNADAPPPWERLASETLHDYTMFRTRRVRSRSPKDGSLHDFHLADSPDGVVLVALTTAGEIVLVEQFRHPFEKNFLELPSGVVDPGETPEQAAERELREETAYQGSSVRLLGTLSLNPSWQTLRVHIVLVQDAERAGAKSLDESEDTRVRLTTPARLRELIRDGTVDSATAVAALALHEWSRPGAEDDGRHGL